nr:3-ketoacyl-CoA thiolase 2, peroxisomal-like [Tanacetum cinerariifolium]
MVETNLYPCPIMYQQVDPQSPKKMKKKKMMKKKKRPKRKCSNQLQTASFHLFILSISTTTRLPCLSHKSLNRYTNSYSYTSGARCVATLLHEMRRRGKDSRFGVVSIFI